jgi:membrane-bound ClpP family serine protease
MNLEFRRATVGAAGMTGIAAALAGSIALLTSERAQPALSTMSAVALAALGTLLLLAVSYRAQRMLSLPR